MTTPNESYDDSVRAAVERETARRKKVFTTFMVLLLVPIAIGTFALAKAPSETTKVVEDVTPIVAERVAQDITTRVTSDVVSRAEPIIRHNVSREITTKVDPQLASVRSTATELRGSITDLGRDIGTLQTNIRQSSELVTRVAPQLASLPEMQASIANFGNEQTELREQLSRSSKALATRVETFDERFSKERDVRQREIAGIRQTLSKELESIRDLVERNSNGHKNAIDSLNRRMTDIESRMKKLTVATATTASNSAWMYGNQPAARSYTPNPLHSYNPTGGAITVQRFAAGVYRVTFANLVTMTGDRANVQVTPYGNGNPNCHVMDWVTTAPPNFITHVRCYNNTDNVNVDSEFTLLVTFK